jgi:hypothetical protein
LLDWALISRYANCGTGWPRHWVWGKSHGPDFGAHGFNLLCRGMGFHDYQHRQVGGWLQSSDRANRIDGQQCPLSITLNYS